MVNPNSNGSIAENARQFQDQLHRLLSKLTDTTDFIKNWPEAKGGDGSMHVERTSQLITKIHTTVQMLQRVEGFLQKDAALRETFLQCRIPLDLLDMLDSSKVNPDLFARGLLREALGQLAGLKRRKLALELLGGAITSGITGVPATQASAENVPSVKEEPTMNDEKDASKKRNIEQLEESSPVDDVEADTTTRKKIKLEHENEPEL
ncbi:hypothetical protein FisN_5Hh326 [Fistulifera solaris]|uniref:Mediator of RNA polymerase II transcription subunit 10 n=1 Tax=Fistulifera solaris TaxID=1519565 RepID=A0A1Z5JT45_FISSO|nr:hypothetical protein FisN_5Hh326 [Fistulifera solaris]|eukprot:GAX16948.1 hypothetical protein FisN_5Hh326 [Fistulifera solaris]